MAKKRQQDFSKTKLKPGRPIGKRKNVTKLSLTTRKIAVQTKKSPKSKFSFPDCLQILKGAYTSARLSALQNLKRVVENQEESFLPYLAEVLEILSKVLLENDSNICNIASDVTCIIISKSSESETFKMKLSSFTPLLTSVISCGMSHSSSDVKHNMLTILSCILTHYPDLICNSFVLLKNMLNMIITRRKSSQIQTLKSRSSLATVSDNALLYENWRIKVLQTINMFLKETLRKYETDVHLEKENEENEVYWDGKKPFHLTIYQDSGLKPFDIEKATNSSNSQEMDFEDPSIIEDFILPVLNVISEIFRSEIAGKKKEDDYLFPVNTIKNLNVLFQLLYHITEWIQVMPCEDVEKIITNFLLQEVYLHNLFPFHPSGIFTVKQSPEVTELNLTLCYLHGKFLLYSEDSNSEYTTSSLLYIKSIFQMSYEIRFKSISMLVKILKMYYELSHVQEVSDFIVYSLCSMSYFLQKIEDGHNKDALISLFMKLSLHPAYAFLTDTVAMQKWFSWLLNQLFNIPKTGEVNKNLLQITKKIANRKHPYFLEALSAVDTNLYKTLLKYDNPEVRDTTIFLIFNMKEVKASLLEDISNIILLDSTFPPRFTIRLIRLLTCKFAEKPSPCDTDIDRKAFTRGRSNFVLFLLNIATDSLNVRNEKLLDYDANKYTKAMEPFKDVCTYNVFPSLKWKDHSELFEVCQKSLHQLPQKIIHFISTGLFKEILDSNRNLPMHCVISILKLSAASTVDSRTVDSRKMDSRSMEDRHYHFLMNNLVFSSLLTTSVLTQMTSPEDEWFLYNVNDLVDNLNLSRSMALETLDDQLENVEEIDGLAVYHILRICTFYLERRLFSNEDSEQVLNILEGYKAKCSDKSFERQPLYQQLYSVFNFYG